MKKCSLTLILILSGILLFGQKNVPLDNWLKSGPVTVNQPAFAKKKDIDGNKFSDKELLKELTIDIEHPPKAGESFSFLGERTAWERILIPGDSIVYSASKQDQAGLLVSYLNLNQWAEINLKITSNAHFEVYVDGKLTHTKADEKLHEQSVQATLHRGKHRIVIKMLNTKDAVKFAATASYNDAKFNDLTMDQSLEPKRSLTIHDILEGKNISSSNISPSGKYVMINYENVQKGSGESLKYSVLKNIKTGENLMVSRSDQKKYMKWLPTSDRLSYAVDINGSTHLYLYDVENSKEEVIAKEIKDLSYYWWSPDEQHIVYSIKDKAEETGETKRIYGNEDRIPGFRDRSYLKLINVESGDRMRLTAGNLSTSFHDFHPSGEKFIFSTSYPVYTEIPYSKQNVYEMNLTDFSLDTIWKDKQYAGQIQYAPKSNRLLVQGGPLCFGEVGVNVSGDKTPNNYDNQLYFYDRESKQAESITKEFKPAVSAAKWFSEEEIYIRVNEKDYINLYRYKVDRKKFEKVNLETEVLGQIDFADDKPFAVYSGTSISSPETLFYLNLKKETSELIDQPKTLDQIGFGKTEKWNFTNKQGTTINGRVYYPPNYDADKKYPVIVYYYGGTSPVERSFDGRYPKNIWAANGYIVYVLQPSGATGFGQDFSALHVNGWGKEQTSDVIEGTKKFLEAHPSADSDNVGAIGASYGGYTTMFLQTQTDIFKTAVSHAGISSISSYWGEGYWGYTYSGVASYKSYPWNNKKLYVEHSPLYNADKFNNSILLLHGTADTNVPVGESKQFYAALKILGKDAEMVLVKDQNHWVIGYDERIKWHHTIMSWFAKELKGKPQWWKHMYPKKYLK